MSLQHSDLDALSVCSKDADVTVAHEAAWTRKQILRALRNQASWNYLRSLCGLSADECGQWLGPRFCAELCNEVRPLLSMWPTCSTGLASWEPGNGLYENAVTLNLTDIIRMN